MTQIMKAKYSQKYKISHMNKVMLKNAQLPNQINCDPILVQESVDYLGWILFLNKMYFAFSMLNMKKLFEIILIPTFSL